MTELLWWLVRVYALGVRQWWTCCRHRAEWCALDVGVACAKPVLWLRWDDAWTSQWRAVMVGHVEALYARHVADLDALDVRSDRLEREARAVLRVRG